MVMVRGLGRAFGVLWRGILAAWGRALYRLFNLRRRLLRGRWPDYVVFDLEGELPERDQPLPRLHALLPFVSRSLSLESLDRALHVVAGDPDVKGILFRVRDAQIGLAEGQSLAALFARFRRWDAELNGPNRSVSKEIVVYLERMSNSVYIMATAADRICLPPLADWNVPGLYTEPTYIADTLKLLGLEMDVVKVAPWKTAFDRFSRSEISEAEREQLNRLLDSLYSELRQAIVAGRNLDGETLDRLIDRAPLSAPAALAHGLIDAVAYEDELPDLLGGDDRPARLLFFPNARPYLQRRPSPPRRGRIGVISLSGAITGGKSRRFPAPLPILGNSTIGSATVQQLARAARRDPTYAAVVIHIDSGGGSALASDLIWRELELLAASVPVVAYLGNVAASGGYYIALPAHRIVCQPASLTGSIGVVTAKVITADAAAKLQVGRSHLSRGKNADLYSDARRWEGKQRDKIEEQVLHTYRVFQERVASGRNLPVEKLEELSGGRVWTGREAREQGLVDRLGDFAAAVEVACELADLPRDGSTAVVNVQSRRPLPPLAGTGREEVEGLARVGLALLRKDWRTLLEGDRVWLLADGLPRDG